jgi:hypothetical protein
LHWACCSNKEENKTKNDKIVNKDETKKLKVIEYLLNNGADINLQNIVFNFLI